MAQRHRICAAIALKVKEIGFRGECGYNQLLYPIESQTRSLLTWLILRLPSAEVASRKENLGANALLNKKIAESLQDWKSQEWRHPSCSYGVPPRIAYNISPLITLDENINARSVSEIFSECGSIGTSAAATILEKHSLELICDMKATSQLESDFDIDDSFDENITSKSILNHTKSEGSILALLSGSGTSDGGFHRSSGSSHPDNSVPWPADRINTAAQLPVAPSEINVEDYEVSVLREEEDNLRRVKIKFLEEKMQSQSIHLLTQKQIQEESSSKLSLLEEKAAQLTANSEVLERDILVKKKTLELIPFAAENIINLMDLCEDAKKKLYQLHQEFDTCRQPYESELYNLKFERDKVCL